MKLAYIRTNYGALNDYTATKEDECNDEEVAVNPFEINDDYLQRLSGNLGESEESDDDN